MKAASSIAPKLQLAVQYHSALEAPDRFQVRRWSKATLAHLAARAGKTRPLARVSLTVRFVDDVDGLGLNRTYRGRDYPTNVLTFVYDDGRGPDVEADLVLCMPVVANEAQSQGKSMAAHCAHLVVHGVLHACGYDHQVEKEADAMEQIERDVLARFRVADPYRTID